MIFKGISFIFFWRRSRQPALVLHVLRLVLHVLCSSRFRVPPLPTSYRLPAKREALVVKRKVKKKWCKKGPLFFLKLIYIIYHVYTYNPICIKMCSQLSYGFKSLQTFGEPTKKNQNHNFYMIFYKMVLKVAVFKNTESERPFSDFSAKFENLME